jgi:hypothetical protein
VVALQSELDRAQEDVRTANARRAELAQVWVRVRLRLRQPQNLPLNGARFAAHAQLLSVGPSSVERAPRPRRAWVNRFP